MSNRKYCDGVLEQKRQHEATHGDSTSPTISYTFFSYLQTEKNDESSIDDLIGQQ